MAVSKRSKKNQMSRSLRQKQQIAAAQLSRHANKENQSQLDIQNSPPPISRRDRTSALLSDLEATNLRLAQVEDELNTTRLDSLHICNQLSDAHSRLSSASAVAYLLQENVSKAIQASTSQNLLLRNERRKVERAKKKTSKLTSDLHSIHHIQLPEVQKELTTANHKLNRYQEWSRFEISRLTGLLDARNLDISRLKKEILSSTKINRALQKRCTRAPGILARAVARVKRAESKRVLTFGLCRKGIVKKQVRQMARVMVKAGCGQAHVGKAIQEVCKGVGVNILGNISRRTVGRAIGEGGVASDIQLGFELDGTQSRYFISFSLTCLMFFLGFTASSDGTSDRHVNFESQHIAYRNPKLTPTSSSKISTHVIRLLGVMSSVDHTSETQVEGWKKRFAELVNIYNLSPLARRHGSALFSSALARKLRGMNGDHAADQKKTFTLMGKWKHSMTILDLGSKKMAASADVNNISQLVSEAHTKKIEAIGGLEVWNSLSEHQKQNEEVSMMEGIAMVIGEEAYINELTDDERRQMDLFLRAGCCMHKDLNAVKGGNAAMIQYWREKEIPGPILLANRDNAATLGDITSSSEASTAAEARAFEVSGAGGVKTISIAGAIFNHKDDKKGQQDSHRIYFQKVKGGHSAKFPNTSNIRYQSHCQAAAELIAYLPQYKLFLLDIKDKKKERRLNHMEQNLPK